MPEALLYFDQPAEAVIDAAARFLAQRGVTITHRSPYSVAFAGPPGTAGTEAGEPAETGAALLPPNSGQMAAVPVQLKPTWCRVWVTVHGQGEAVAAAAAFVAEHQAGSRRVAAAVQELERGVYDEARWPGVEAQLRASLAKQGADQAAVEARVAAVKRRWLALARKAAAAPPEEPDEPALA